MNRREALKRTAMVMGTALSATTVAGIMNGCTANPELSWTPVLFSPEQAQLITSLCETIIPKTETPGAADAGVPQFIENMVSNVYSEEDRTKFLTNLAAFDMASEEKNGGGFASLEAEKQTAFLDTYNTQMQEALRSGNRMAPKPDMQCFRNMKELTVVGFFTSQPGATQVLQYKQIPVDYHGCISLEEAGGKTWAT